MTDRWWERAACRGAQPRLFDVDTHRRTGPNSAAAAAASVQRIVERYCDQCPVLLCAADAAAHNSTGIRGGELRTQEHGSVTAYNLHKKRGEQACPACLEAARAYGGDRRDPARAAKQRRAKAFA